MIKIDSRGCSCWSDAIRHDGDIVFLSLFGHRNAVRGIWASIVSRKRGDPGIWIDSLGVRLRVADEERYTTISSSLHDRNSLHIVLVHNEATRQSTVTRDRFFQIGPDPSTKYFSRLTQLCRVPMRESWSDAIWQIGLRGKAIVPVFGFGISVHKIDTHVDTWAPLVKQAIVDGVLS